MLFLGSLSAWLWDEKEGLSASEVAGVLGPHESEVSEEVYWRLLPCCKELRVVELIILLSEVQMEDGSTQKRRNSGLNESSIGESYYGAT